MSQNKKTLLLGFSLMGAAFVCIIVTFYFMGKSDRVDKEKVSSMQTQIEKLQEQTQNLSKMPSAMTTPSSPVKLEDLVKTAESTYDPAEKQRKEGFLWLDHRSSSFIVTLGALQGLQPGSQLNIYDGNKKIDIASVDVPFDVVSYVKPQKNSADFFNSNYYRVVIEDHPEK